METQGTPSVYEICVITGLMLAAMQNHLSTKIKHHCQHYLLLDGGKRRVVVKYGTPE